MIPQSHLTLSLGTSWPLSNFAINLILQKLEFSSFLSVVLIQCQSVTDTDSRTERRTDGHPDHRLHLHTNYATRLVKIKLHDHFTVKCIPCSIIFLARDSIIYAERAIVICCRSSACLSIRLSVRPSHGWISQKRLKLGSYNFHRTVVTQSL